MNREIASNLVAIDSLFCTALCQINLCIDNRYVAISKWLHDCLTERRVCDVPDIEAYDVTIGVTTTPPETIEDHIANPSEFEEKERYRGDTVEVLIERYRKLTVVELKANLRQVGIKPRGLKKDLVRLLAEKEYQRLYSAWENRREEAIRKEEQERIERIRDGIHQLKEKAPEVRVLSPLKSPVSVRLILTPRKAGLKSATEEVTSSSRQVLGDASGECVQGVQTPVKRDRGCDGVDEVPRKKADRKNGSAVVASCGVNGEAGVAGVAGVSTPVKASIPVKIATPVKVEASSPNSVTSPVKIEPSSPVKTEQSPVKVTSPVKVEPSGVRVEVPPVKAEPSPVKAASPVKTESPPMKPQPSPIKTEAPPIQSSSPSSTHPSSTKETHQPKTTPSSVPQPRTNPAPSQPALERSTPSKLPSKKPQVSISTTPLHGLPALQTSSSMVKDAESNGSRGSGNESIQAKTQLLLQRVEGMKKRKEERLQHSVLLTPGKPMDAMKTRPKIPSRGLAGLSALKGGITLDEDLSMPALPAVADTMERSFISIVSSPAAQRKHAPSVSKDISKKQKEELPPKRTIPLGARRVPVQKTPSDVQKSNADLSKAEKPDVTKSTPDVAKPQPSHSSTPKPQPSQSSTPKPQPSQSNTPKPQPPQSNIPKPHSEAALQEPTKKRALPTQNKNDPEPKRPAVEPPKLPSNRSRPATNATSTLPESTPNLEVLRQLVDSEKVDPTKRWYEEGNIEILLRKQYYESFTNGITAGLVFAPSDEIRLDQVLPMAPADHFERRPSDVWN